MRVTLKPGAAAVKAKPRRYDPVKSSWLASGMGALVAFGLVFRNLQAVWSSPAMAVAKKDSFRLVSDYGATNDQVEKSPGVMPSQESDMIDLSSARCFGKSDLLQGNSQIDAVGQRGARDIHHHNYVWHVYPATSTARRVECYFLFSRCHGRPLRWLEMQNFGG
ncbi:unnamed protein product [Sphacelaria rigidula]